MLRCAGTCGPWDRQGEAGQGVVGVGWAWLTTDVGLHSQPGTSRASQHACMHACSRPSTHFMPATMPATKQPSTHLALRHVRLVARVADGGGAARPRAVPDISPVEAGARPGGLHGEAFVRCVTCSPLRAHHRLAHALAQHSKHRKAAATFLVFCFVLMAPA